MKPGSLINRFASDRRGNVAMIVAISLIPLLMAAGAAIDTARLHNAYSRVQSNLDTALMAAVNEIGTDDKAKIVAKVNAWFKGQQAVNDGSFDMAAIDVDLDEATVTATIKGKVPTTLAGIMGIEQMPVEVTSSAKGGDRPHLQVIYALDKSASMLLIGNLADQRKMQDEVGCAFACHTSEGRVRDTQYMTFYAYAKAHNYTMRIDIANKAIRESLSVIKGADPSRQRIKVGLYKIGSDAQRVMDPSYDLDDVNQHLVQDRYGLTDTTSDNTTYFNRSLATLANSVGMAGQGQSAATPKKFVIIVTDGVQAEQDWVHHHKDRVAPLNPRWCDALKNKGATVAVLYTQYLAMWWDWGYNETIGDSMGSANWYDNWGGIMRPGVSPNTSRHDYLPMAMQDCASAPNLFLSADKPAEIETALKQLLKNYLSVPRLTR